MLQPITRLWNEHLKSLVILPKVENQEDIYVLCLIPPLYNLELTFHNHSPIH
jgi:hypothetical protein